MLCNASPIVRAREILRPGVDILSGSRGIPSGDGIISNLNSSSEFRIPGHEEFRRTGGGAGRKEEPRAAGGRGRRRVDATAKAAAAVARTRRSRRRDTSDEW